MKTVFILMIVCATAIASNFSISGTSKFTTNGISRFSVAAVAAGCSTSYDSNTGTVTDNASVGTTSGELYAGIYDYPAPSTASPCEIHFKLTAHGTVSGFTYTCRVYTYPGNSSLTGGYTESTGVVGVNGWSQTDVTFSFSGLTLTSGTGYNIVLTSNAAADAVNYVSMDRTDAGGFASGTSYFQTWDSGGTGSNFSTKNPKVSFFKP